MKFLLDTCVLSELIKKAPNEKVVSWVSGLNENDLYLSVLTVGEIYKGVEKLKPGARKTELHNWVSHDLQERFKGRILDFDLPTASIWGKLQGESESVGRPMPAIDGQIAATGVFNNLTIATRNIADMEASGASLYNPWE